MRVLILGASGRIGRLLPPAFAGHEVRAASRADADLRDRAALDRLVAGSSPDAVVLAAGMADADACEDRPGDAYAANVDGVRNAAEASGGRPFALFSTDHVFDGKAGPYLEEDRPAPLSVYGRTKLEGERVALAVNPRTLVIRTTLVFGGGGADFFTKLRDAKQPVSCWKDHVATYTWAPVLAEATAELVVSGRSGIWHVANTDVLDRHAFALKVAARFGKDPALYRPVSLREAPPRAPRPLRAGVRTDKARGALRTKFLTTDEALEVAFRSYGGS